MTAALADQLETRAASTEVAKATQEETVLQAIERQGAEIARALPAGMTPERFTRIVITAVKQTPALQTCSASSLLGAVMLSAQLGLEPGPLGHAYFVPFKNQVTFIVGYKGLIDLAMRSRKIESIIARDVRANDTFDYELGTDERIVHKPAMGERGNTIAYYAVARLVGGGKIMHVMSREDVERHRLRSSSGNRGPWTTDYDAMARKTVIRTMSPYLPMSIEAARAVANDDVIVTSIDADLADRTPEPNVIDVEGHEDDDPKNDGPGGGAATTAPTSAGGSNGGTESPSTDGPVPPAAAASTVGESGGDAASVSGDRQPDSPAVETVNEEGAQKVAMWCADAGIGDDLRPMFLYAFGGYTSAKDVPVDKLGELRATLDKVKRGDLELVPADADGTSSPFLREPGAGDSTESSELPPPASIGWKAALGQVKGVGEAKLLRKAREVAAADGYDPQLIVSLDTIPPALNNTLRAWLEETAAA